MGKLVNYYVKLLDAQPYLREMKISPTDYRLLYGELSIMSRVLTQDSSANYAQSLMLKGCRMVSDPSMELTSNGATLAQHWEKLIPEDKTDLLEMFKTAYDAPPNLHMGTLPFVTCLQAYKAMMFQQPRHRLMMPLRRWGEIKSG